MKLKELKKDNFAALKEIPDSFVRLNQVNAYYYIEHLAGLTSTDITSWDVDVVFTTGKDEKTGATLIETDKSKINQIFFKTREVGAPITDADIDNFFTTAEKEKINKHEEDFLNSSRNVLKNNVASAMRNAESRYQQYKDYISQASIARKKLEKIPVIKGGSMAGKIAASLKERPFYRYLGISGGMIHLITQPIVVREIVKAAGVDFGVTFKPMHVEIYLDSFDLRVHPREYMTNRIAFLDVPKAKAYYDEGGKDRAIMIGSYFHPHIGSNGQPCFGTGDHLVASAQHEGDLAKILDVLQHVLTHYNPDNPYVSLRSFFDKAKPEDRIGALHKDAVPAEDGEEDHEEDYEPDEPDDSYDEDSEEDR